MFRNHSLPRILTAFGEFVASWWRLDRIRTTPRQGRLLRIAPGSCLCIHEKMLEIVSREIRDTSQGTLVCYEIRSHQGLGELWIAPESPESVLWIHDSGEEQLLADEIEIWGRDKIVKEGS